TRNEPVVVNATSSGVVSSCGWASHAPSLQWISTVLRQRQPSGSCAGTAAAATSAATTRPAVIGSVPRGRVFFETRLLDLDHAEAVASRRFHHDPGLHVLHALRAEFFEARDLGFDVVGLDVEVHAGRMLDALRLDVHAAVVVHELHVAVALL